MKITTLCPCLLFLLLAAECHSNASKISSSACKLHMCNLYTVQLNSLAGQMYSSCCNVHIPANWTECRSACLQVSDWWMFVSFSLQVSDWWMFVSFFPPGHCNLEVVAIGYCSREIGLSCYTVLHCINNCCACVRCFCVCCEMLKHVLCVFAFQRLYNYRMCSLVHCVCSVDSLFFSIMMHMQFGSSCPPNVINKTGYLTSYCPSIPVILHTH